MIAERSPRLADNISKSLGLLVGPRAVIADDVQRVDVRLPLTFYRTSVSLRCISGRAFCCTETTRLPCFRYTASSARAVRQSTDCPVLVIGSIQSGSPVTTILAARA